MGARFYPGPDAASPRRSIRQPSAGYRATKDGLSPVVIHRRLLRSRGARTARGEDRPGPPPPRPPQNERTYPGQTNRRADGRTDERQDGRKELLPPIAVGMTRTWISLARRKDRRAGGGGERETENERPDGFTQTRVIRTREEPGTSPVRTAPVDRYLERSRGEKQRRLQKSSGEGSAGWCSSSLPRDSSSVRRSFAGPAGSTLPPLEADPPAPRVVRARRLVGR